jgi:hypothetical protein
MRPVTTCKARSVRDVPDRVAGQASGNHEAKKACNDGEKLSGLYSNKSGSYDRCDGRPPPTSQQTCKKIRRRPEASPAEPDLVSQRQRLVALLSRIPDEVLAVAYPEIEARLRKAAHMPCAKGSGRHGKPASGQAALDFRFAEADCSKARHGNGKVKHPPRLAAPYRWPKKKFSTEFRRRGISIVDFLREEWSELISAGYGELRWLRMVDPSAATAVENYERVDPKSKKRKQLPLDVRFLREREVVNLKLSMGFDATKPDPRLLDAAARRLRRGMSLIVS